MSEGSSVLSALKRVLRFEMTIAEWIGTAAMFAAPYLAVGVLWSLTVTGRPGSVVWWPVQLVSTVCAA